MSQLYFGIFLCIILTSIASYFDIKRRIVPNGLTLIASIIALTYVIITGRVIDSMIAALTCVIILLFARKIGDWFYRSPGFGMGDIKWMFPFGLFLGLDAFWALYLGIFIGAVYSIVLRAKSLEPNSNLQYHPFMPFLWGGILLSLLFPFPQWLLFP